YFIIAAVDNSGNVSPLSAEVNATTILPELAGDYIIDKSGSGDYTSFVDAAVALAGGISGPVTFTVKDGGDGIYEGQVTIGSITGTNASSTVTFQPDSNNTSDITLAHNVTDGNNWIVKLDGSQYITFDGFIFQPLDPDSSRIFHLIGDADHITLMNNTFNGSMAAVDNLQQTHIYAEGAGGEVPDSTIILDNTFTDNSYGIYMVGISGTEAGYAEIVGNEFLNQFAQGLYLRYYDAPVIGWNTIVSRPGAFSFEAITLLNCIDDTEIVANIIDSGGDLGLHIISSSGRFGVEGLIVNNLIRVGGIATSVGIKIDGGDYWHIYHNTIDITGTSASAGRAFDLQASTVGQLDLRNNIFANTGGGYAFYVNGGLEARITTSNNNLLYTTGTNITYWNGAAQKTLAEFQAGGKHLNSISANPLFIHPDTLNYRLRDDSPAIGLGDPDSDLLDAAGGNSDLEGNDRPSAGSVNPDAGAYENDRGTPSEDAPPDPPAVTTGLPARISATAALLRGSVNPRGLSTDVYFDYGLTTSYGDTVQAARNLVGAADTTVGARLSDLTPGARYHYRLVATSSTGTTTGGDITFVTPTDTTVTVDNRLVSGDAAVTFPSAGILLDFTFTGTPGSNIIQVIKFRAAPDGVLPENFALFANRYWEFNHIGPGTFTVAITFNLGFAGVNSGNLAGDFRLLRRESGGTGTWSVIVQAATTLTDSTMTFTGIGGFSQFTVVKFVPDVAPPAISSTILVTPGRPVDAGIPLEITAAVTDDRGVDRVSLHYAQGGSSDFSNPVVMSASGADNYTATIPGAAVTHNGLIFVIRARDAAANADSSAIQFVPVKFVSGELTLANIPGAYTSGYPKDRWRLLSVPADLDAPAVADAIGAELGAQTDETWRIFSYVNENYVENPRNFIAGAAYWLYQRVEDNIQFEVGTGRTHDLQAPDITVGARQWSLIGNPYPFPVTVVPDTSFFGPLAYQGDGGSEGWSAVTQLRPWGGYAVFNKAQFTRPLILRAVPLAKQLAKGNAEPSDMSGWVLHLRAVGRTYSDGTNAIGRRAGATEQLDIYDDPEPPYIDGYISLAMERPEWGANLPRWTSDIRSLQESDGVWDMALYSKGESGPIRLTANLQGEFLPGGRIVLMDLITRQVVDLLPGSAPLVITDYREEFPYHLKIVAGSASYVESTTEEILASLPAAFALKQNYPNPFNPTTRLEYSVFRPARVSLKVYNILGQELVTLADGWQDLGHYTVVWNGRDRFGSQLASGIYFAVYTAEGRSMTRKMVMMK
ncbi:MAG: T9SS type A sorting domain-containing protein, partial [Candidatus Marinimicrobia bacterium]|nr:T9SS type A sorting domain-containing protein [Candidatus Neomarinimicrobiota bacterium]